MNYGVIFNEPFAEYLSADAVSAHRLDDIARPIVYRGLWIDRTIPRRADTPALSFGRLFHCLALEGEHEVEKRYVVLPADAPEDLRRYRNAKKPSEATVKAIAWWDDFQARCAGREIITDQSLEIAWTMVRSIREKTSAVKLLSRGKPEVTFRHKLPNFSIQCRSDWFDAEDTAGPLTINVKTVESLDDFDRQYENLGYYRSDAFYRMVIGKVVAVLPTQVQCLNLVCEKNPPYEVAIRAPDATTLEIGSSEVMRNLRSLDRCYETNTWPGEPDEMRPVSLSEWKIRRAEQEAA